MGFLERSKVTLTVRCETTTCVPGAVIPGELLVEVHETVTFTALRLQLRGKEKFYIRKRDSNGNHYYIRREFVHVEEIFTLIGASSSNAASGTTQLMPGVYSYPFSVVIPINAPPSFCVAKPEYGCSVAYHVKGILDIPYGFDAEAVHTIQVLQTIAMAQLQAARQTLVTLPTSEAYVAGCECCGCFCCVDEKAFIRTEAVLAPSVVVMQASDLQLPEVMAVPPAQGAGGQGKGWEEQGEGGLGQPWPVSGSVSAAVLRIRVTNFAAKASPSSCKVKVRQRHFFEQDRGVAYHDYRTLHSCVVPFPCGPLAFGQSVVVTVPFQVDGNSPDLSSGETLPPSITTQFIDIATEIAVTFPDIDAEGTLFAKNAFMIANDVDMTNQSVPMPHTYKERLQVVFHEGPL